jgi:hypothetical protein
VDNHNCARWSHHSIATLRDTYAAGCPRTSMIVTSSIGIDEPPRLIAVSPGPTNGALFPLDDAQPVDARRVRAADQLGVSAGTIERLPFDLSVLDEGGIFINVDTHNFGLLDRRLDWRALGITLPRGTDLAFRAPRCGLVPDRYRLPLLRPAAQAHSALHRHSYRFRLIETVFETPSYRWTPWRAWPDFEQAFATAQGRLATALDAYEADFETIRASVIATFRGLAADSMRRLAATGQPVGDDFVDLIVMGVEAALPTPQALRERLTLRFRVGVMQLGSELWAEQRRAAEERRRVEVTQAELRLEQRRLSAQERVVQEQLWAEQERIRQQCIAQEEDSRRELAIKEQLRQLKLQAARERLEEALSPLEEGAQQLRAAVFESASAILASLQKHRALRGPSARKARSLCKWFAAMNWTDDQQLEQLIRELEQLARTPAGVQRKRDPGPLQQVLGDIVRLTYADSRDLVEPNRMAALEI